MEKDNSILLIVEDLFCFTKGDPNLISPGMS